MKKLLTMLLAAAMPGMASCSSVSNSIGDPQSPNNAWSRGGTSTLKASGGVGANAISIAKSTRNHTGLTETHAYFAFYTSRFGTEGHTKWPAAPSCEAVPSPLDDTATLTRTNEPKKEGC